MVPWWISWAHVDMVNLVGKYGCDGYLGQMCNIHAYGRFEQTCSAMVGILVYVMIKWATILNGRETVVRCKYRRTWI